MKKPTQTMQIFECVLKCKWSFAVIDRIEAGAAEPTVLLAEIEGLSKKVLYDRLNRLLDLGILEKIVLSEKPLRVRYELTPQGKKVSAVIQIIKEM